MHEKLLIDIILWFGENPIVDIKDISLGLCVFTGQEDPERVPAVNLLYVFDLFFHVFYN